nr:recombinase family protein [Bradyrhizobium sp. Cp5.3]
MRVSPDSDRQSTDLQRDALLAAGVDPLHLFEDHASGAKDDRTGLARALEFVRPGDVPVVWKLARLGRSLSHLLAIVISLKDNRMAFRSLTENPDTTTPSGEFLFQVFGALAQYERALIQERVVAGLAAARKRSRPQAITGEKLDAIIAALDGGMSKAAVCRNFGVKRTTLIETLARVGWMGSVAPAKRIKLSHDSSNTARLVSRVSNLQSLPDQFRSRQTQSRLRCVLESGAGH